jgi:hypothetical protein
MTDEPDTSPTRGLLDGRTADALVTFGAALALVAKRVDLVEGILDAKAQADVEAIRHAHQRLDELAANLARVETLMTSLAALIGVKPVYGADDVGEGDSGVRH